MFPVLSSFLLFFTLKQCQAAYREVELVVILLPNPSRVQELEVYASGQTLVLFLSQKSFISFIFLITSSLSVEPPVFAMLVSDNIPLFIS